MDKLRNGLAAYHQSLDELREALVEWKDFETVGEGLYAHSMRLSQAMIQLGNMAFELLQRSGGSVDNGIVQAWRLSYEWPEEARSFLLLMRNILFELERAKLFEQDSEVEAGQLEALLLRSRDSLRKIAEEFGERLKGDPPPEMDRKIKRWRLQKNPWETYREQIKKIPEQILALKEQNALLDHNGILLRGIAQGVQQMLVICEEELEDVKVAAQKTRSFIGEECGEVNQDKLKQIQQRIEKAESKAILQDHLLSFSKDLEDQLEELPDELTVIMDTQGGKLVKKEITLRRQVTLWTESELLPLLYEIWELTESAFNGYKMSLVNIQSRVNLMSSEVFGTRQRYLNPEDLCQPMSNFLAQLDRSFENSAQLRQMVRERMDRDLKLANIYRKEIGFLDATDIPSGGNGLDRNPLWIRTKKWWDQQMLRLRAMIRSVEEEEALNDSEKIVRFINSRSPDPENSHYTSIFITKGYIGESFCVGRDRELRAVENLIGNWKRGFRGSLCITGNRFAGKTLFGEMIGAQHFPGQTIRIRPNETFRWEGNRLGGSYDLGATLDEIKKLTLNHRPMIWIDDFELWWSPDVPIMRNAKALQRHLDDYSNHAFIVVSMSNWAKRYMDVFQGFDRVFQSRINLDRMSQEEIREAILIRHGATHMKLRDADGRKLNPQQIKKVTRKIFISSEGNIGKALHLWAHSTHKLDDLRVFNDFSDDFSLPDFLNQDTATLLSFFRMQKRCNEYRLRKYFGPAFRGRYNHVVKRLVSVGILLRQMDGWLEINPLLIPEVDQLLEHSEYQTYSTWKR